MDMHAPKVCFVSPCKVMGESIYERLAEEGFKVDWIKDTNQAFDIIRNAKYDVVVSEMCRRDMSNEHFFRRLRANTENIPPTFFILKESSTTNHKQQSDTVDTINSLATTVDLKSLINKLRDVQNKNGTTDHSLKTDCPLGISAPMRKLDEKIHILAPYKQTPVLIVGESGVGKEVVARRIHAIQNSPGQFVAINCAAIPHSLIESELFGYEKGAFTGSTKRHRGVFEQANNGSLLLDEIGEMPLSTQAKLLRVIQEKTIVRIGGEQDIPVNIRIICATNCDLRSKVERGEFREDLYYRINVIELNIPPLRQRPEDIHWLVNKFLDNHTKLYAGKVKKLDSMARQEILEYSWPGNVRELKNSIERACIMTPSSTVYSSDIFSQKPEIYSEQKIRTLKDFLKNHERTYIDTILRENCWNITNTAETLGISRKSLWEKMKKYNIHRGY